MATVAEMAKRFQELDLIQLGKQIAFDDQDRYLDLNKDQLTKGRTKDDRVITPGYRRAKYARVKHEMNPLPGLGRPDLKLTGAWYAGFRLMETPGPGIEVYSEDDKNLDLLEKYGEEIFGLNESNMEKYRREYFMPELVRHVADRTGTGIGKQ